MQRKYQRHKQQSRALKVTNRGPWKLYLTVLATIALFALSTLYAFADVIKIGPESWRQPFALGLDLQGGTHLEYQANMDSIPLADRADALEGVRDVIERRVNSFGVSEPVVQTSATGGTYRLMVELAGVLDVNQAIEMIGETPILEFKEPGQVLQRDPTPEENVQLKERQAVDRASAKEVLATARTTTDFASLAKEKSIDQFSKEQGGSIGVKTKDDTNYGELVTKIANAGLGANQVFWNLVETKEGINIVRLNEKKEIKKIQAQHLLICFEGAKNCQKPIPNIEANLLIADLKEKATPENFDQLVRENSTEPGASETGGDLGWFGPGDMVLPFELSAQQTAVGTISDVVETEFGYHLIYKKAEKEMTGYDISRILLPLTQIFDVVPESSPWTNTALSGSQLKSANVEFDQQTGAPYVTIKFNPEGSKLFADLTTRLKGKQIAIFLDNEMISAPVVNDAIYGGEAVIQGQFTLDEAKILAQRLNAGALPVPVELLSQQTIGPTLGKLSLQQSMMAGLIGLILVGLFMLLYYRLSGFISVIALLMYASFNLAMYKLLGVTITLAGIAGFILSIGMAVDANVLIFERMKEELRSGRGLQSSVEEGFKRAWTSIRDGNLTTLIASAILFWFSTSFIKGFALTLSIGVLLSMFSAIIISRVWMSMITRWSWLKKLGLYARIKSTHTS